MPKDFAAEATLILIFSHCTQMRFEPVRLSPALRGRLL